VKSGLPAALRLQVMSTETRTRITADEFHALDLPRYSQLIEGEIVLTAPKAPHQLIVGRIFRALADWTEGAAGRGSAWLPLDVEIDRHNVYEPDVLWVTEAHPPDFETGLELIPDLCVEVRSPSTWRYDVGVKKTRYEQHGLPELWLVDNRADVVLVFRRSTSKAAEFDVALELSGADTLTSPQLATFSLPLTELFAPLG
jgi:Uma2 family endonuclease